MLGETIIPAFDLVGTAGFLAATVMGVRNYRETDVAQVFWLSFTFASALGAVWLALVTLEWLGVHSVLLDVFSTSLQAVVIGVFAVGAVAGLATLDRLRTARAGFERQRRTAEAAKAQAEQRRRELEGFQVLLNEVETMATVGGWERDLGAGTFRVTRGIREIVEGPETPPETLEEFIEYFHPDDRPTFRRAVDRCRETGESFHLELRMLTAERKEIWVETRGSRLEDAEGTILRGVIHDISERREREQQLMVFNRVLRHNLRNKLTVILGHVQALEEELAESPAASVGERAEKIAVCAQDLRTLSEKVGEFQRAARAGTAAQAVAVRPIAQRLRSNYATRYPDAEIELSGVDVSIRGHPQWLRLVLDELVENAITHHDGDRPRVVIEGDASGDDRVAVRVRDDGPGLPAVERQVLARGEETPLSHGSGIGLWTVHWLMTRLGGSIEIFENEPEGTVVELRFPGVE